MPLITIREIAALNDEPNVVLSIDGRGEFKTAVKSPFSDAQEKELVWYFEEHLRFPFTGQKRALQAAKSIQDYGEALFAQLFSDIDLYTSYKQATQSGLQHLAFEIIGSPENIHSLHWEALKDPKLSDPFSVRSAMIRRTFKASSFAASTKPSPTLNILLITSRPKEGEDISYRTISRPLVESMQKSGIPVSIDLVRPGTFRALAEHLDRKGPGYYHVLHFDLHGAVLTYQDLQKAREADRLLFQARWGRVDISEFPGHRAFIFFESEKKELPEPTSAQELADRIFQHYSIPVAIINACQSGKQVGGVETVMASQLLQAGVKVALGMSYSVTVSAARIMMSALYQRIMEGNDLNSALQKARFALSADKGRRAHYNQSIDLEDWMLPVVYQQGIMGENPLDRRSFTPQEEYDFNCQRANVCREAETVYGFVGRDLDVLRIERKLLLPREGSERNLLLIKGMGGSGKTALLRHLARWWQTTGLAGEVSYFGYDEKAWKLEEILQTLAQKLYGPKVEASGRPSFELLSFQAMPIAAQIQKVASGLQSQKQRHLLILDNLESVTGEGLAIKNTLSEEERQELCSFLKELAGGRSLVLFGTRGGEDWLMDGHDGPLHSSDLYELEGLDPEAASDLAQRVLERNISDPDIREEYMRSDELSRLMKILSGYPLAIQVVLSNLRSQTPAQVMETLRLGKEGLDQKDTQDKTKSILKCIDYSHSNLSAEDQRLLLCLAPFTSILPAYTLGEYTSFLKEQPTLSALPFDRWQDVLGQVGRWGLATMHEIQGFLRLQPTFPYFLSTRLNREDAQFKASVEIAFYKLYNLIAQNIGHLNRSNDPKEKKTGQILMELEFENLSMALDMALKAKAPVLSIYTALSQYYDIHQNHSLGLKMGQKVIEKIKGYSGLAKNDSLRLEFIAIMDNAALRHLMLKDYTSSQKLYQDILNFLHDDSDIIDEKQEKICAGVYHQLGMVAQAQRKWNDAEDYYQKALKIFIEFNDRYEQAGTYHQLGRVAEEQRKWDEAEDYYQKALKIYIEFNDRYGQAGTYHQLGSVAQEQRKWDKAEDYYQKALKICFELNANYDKARVYHQLGMVAQEQRKWDEAEDYYQKALRIEIEFNDRYSQASTYHQLGRVAQEQRKWDEAEDYYQKALRIKIEFNDRYSQASTYHQLGNVAEEQRKWDEAEDYYQKALRIKIEFNDRYSQASTYHQLGRVAEEQRKWDEAEDYYQKALAILKEFKDEYSVGIVQNSLARLKKESGKEGAHTG